MLVLLMFLYIFGLRMCFQVFWSWQIKGRLCLLAIVFLPMLLYIFGLRSCFQVLWSWQIKGRLCLLAIFVRDFIQSMRDLQTGDGHAYFQEA